MAIKLYNSYTAKYLTLEDCLVTATNLGFSERMIWRIEVASDTSATSGDSVDEKGPDSLVYYCLVTVPHGKVPKPQIVIGAGAEPQATPNEVTDDNIWDLVEPRFPDWWNLAPMSFYSLDHKKMVHLTDYSMYSGLGTFGGELNQVWFIKDNLTQNRYVCLRNSIIYETDPHPTDTLDQNDSCMVWTQNMPTAVTYA